MNNKGMLPVGLVLGFLVVFTIIDNSDFSGFSKGSNSMHLQSTNYLHKETVEERVEVYESEDKAVSTNNFTKKFFSLFNRKKDEDTAKNESVDNAGSEGGGSAIAGTKGWYFPLDGDVYVTDLIGTRGSWHSAIDLAYSSQGKTDAPIYAVNSGVVTKVVYEPTAGGGNSGRGHYVTIEHDMGGTKYYSSYAHMKSRPLVSVGQSVGTGQKLGIMGKTGDPSGRMKIHLHLEIGIEDKPGRPNAKKYLTSQLYSTAPRAWWYKHTSEWSRLDPRDFISELKGTKPQTKVRRKVEKPTDESKPEGGGGAPQVPRMAP